MCPPGDPLTLSAGALLDSLRVNAAGPLVAAQEAARHMPGAGAEGTHFDPDLIAEQFWELHVQPEPEWELERTYR